MRLRTRLILALCFLALIVANSIGWGRPWMGILAYGLGGVGILIQMSERRVRGTGAHATMNLPR